MMIQFIQLLTMQFKEFFREPGALFWSFVFPILMSLGLGMAFNDKPDVSQNVAVVMPEQSRDTLLKTFLEKRCTKIKDKSNEYSITIDNKNLGKNNTYFVCTSWKESEIMMKRGQISAILSEKNNKINYHFDPASSASRLTYITVSDMLNGKSMLSDDSMIKPLNSKGSRYIDFLIPGLLAMGIMSSCLWGICYGLIEKRSKKLLRRMVATPMKKSYFMITMFLSRFVLTILETVALLVFAYFVFDVSIQGSLIAYSGMLIAGSFFFMGLSILLASKTSNTQVGNGLVSAITMPMMLLSGIFFSYSNFPDFIIPFIRYLPLTLFTDSLRSITNEGYGITEIILPFSILSFSGLIAFFAGLKIYKWY